MTTQSWPSRRSLALLGVCFAIACQAADGERKRSRMFEALQSRYLFEDRFGRPACGNDKGNVEGMVGFTRRTFMVPIPHATDIGEVNAMLLERCRARMGAVLRGANGANIGARLEADRVAFMDLAVTPFDACDKRPGRVSSLSLVRYKNTDYSVPVAYAHRDVVVRAYVGEVVVEAGAEEIARHRRSYEVEDFVFDPLHYLDLIERKVPSRACKHAREGSGRTGSSGASEGLGSGRGV